MIVCTAYNVEKVAEKIAKTIALVVHRTAQVALLIVLYMVHQYVMRVIAVGRHPEERAENPIDVSVEECGAPREQRAMRDVVVHGKETSLAKPDEYKQIS